jgi:GT2 family glycosyltransferase
MRHAVDVLIPTYRRPAALALTLSSLCSQQMRDFRVVISDQTEDDDIERFGEVLAVMRVLKAHGHVVELHKHLPRRGMAEQRQFLLDQAVAPYVLFLDDDVILEPDVIGRMLSAIQEEGCGFVGCAVIGLSYINDLRPDEQRIEFWSERVRPEAVTPDSPSWDRYRLHNAANLYHLQERLRAAPGQQFKYRVAWVGGCVLFSTSALRDVGGFSFWPELPPDHCGEDVLVQLRVMSAYGGCGLLPSGAYHQELPTTIPNRACDAPKLLQILPEAVQAGRSE